LSISDKIDCKFGIDYIKSKLIFPFRYRKLFGLMLSNIKLYHDNRKKIASIGVIDAGSKAAPGIISINSLPISIVYRLAVG
jgi:hypothetical protein